MEQTKSSFKYLRPILRELSFKDNNSEQLKSDLPINLETEIIKEEESNHATIIVRLSIGNDTTPFDLHIAMSGKFKWDDQPEEQVAIFLKQNAPSLILSFMRPIVYQITGSSQFPPIEIPFLDLTVNESID